MPAAVRAVLAALLAVVALAATTASAQAVLRFTINETRTSGAASDFVLRVLTGGGQLTYDCRLASFAATISGNVVTVARGAATFTGCPGATITQTEPWTTTVVTLLNLRSEIIGLRATLTIPADGLKVEIPNFGCTFYVAGTRTTLVPLSPGVPLGTLVTVPALPFTDEELSLRTMTVTARCADYGITGANTVNLRGTFGLSPAITGTLVDVP